MSLAEMSPVTREHGVRDLALRAGELLEDKGEVAGPTIVQELADALDVPISDLRLALARLPLVVTSAGTVRIVASWRADVVEQRGAIAP